MNTNGKTLTVIFINHGIKKIEKSNFRKNIKQNWEHVQYESTVKDKG